LRPFALFNIIAITYQKKKEWRNLRSPTRYGNFQSTSEAWQTIFEVDSIGNLRKIWTTEQAYLGAKNKAHHLMSLLKINPSSKQVSHQLHASKSGNFVKLYWLTFDNLIIHALPNWYW
jgi:hypothetical protein